MNHKRYRVTSNVLLLLPALEAEYMVLALELAVNSISTDKYESQQSSSQFLNR